MIIIGEHYQTITISGRIAIIWFAFVYLDMFNFEQMQRVHIISKNQQQEWQEPSRSKKESNLLPNQLANQHRESKSQTENSNQ